MFQNASTIWIEIIVLFFVVVFLMTVLGVYIYKKIKHLPTGDCACCHMSSNKLLKKYYKAYPKK